MKILLDYFFPIVAEVGTQQASTAFLRQVCVVVPPKMGVTTGVITACTSMGQVNALTDSDECQQLFDAGLNKVYILPMDDLDLNDVLSGESRFFTLLLDSSFSEADIDITKSHAAATVTSYANLVSGTPDKVTIAGIDMIAQSGAVTLGDTKFQAATSNNATAASLAAQINAHATLKTLVVATVVGAVVTITAKNFGDSGNAITLVYTDNDTNVGITLANATGGHLNGAAGLLYGPFKGVVGFVDNNEDWLVGKASMENVCAFYTIPDTGARDLFYAFGKLLADQTAFTNQQYIEMPLDGGVDDLGFANQLFEDKISFVLNDDEYGRRLGLFACGGKAITAPYIIKNLQIDMQSAALNYVSLNQPDYTITEASLIEDELQKVIDTKYVATKQLASGTASVDLQEDNFIANAEIDVPTPRAMWRIFGKIKES